METISQVLLTIFGALIGIAAVSLKIYQDLVRAIKSSYEKPTDYISLVFLVTALMFFIIMPLFIMIGPWIWPEIFIFN